VAARARVVRAKRDAGIIEHSIGSSEHGTVLSLWVPEAVADRVGMQSR